MTPASTELVPVAVLRAPRDLDLGRVAAALVLAVLGEDLALLAHVVGAAERVPDVGVAGDELERALRAAAADQDRERLPRRRRVQLAHARLDARHRLLEQVEAGALGPEVVAVLVEVLLEPAGADAEDRPAAGDLVDRAVGVGEVVGVAVRVADDERAELDALGHLRHRAEHGQALEVLAFRLPAQRIEVVPVEEAVDAELLRIDPRLAHGGPVGVLGLELGGHTDLRHAISMGP